jgi:hypothetical protein
MLLAIAAQKPRPAGSNRSARLERGDHRLFDARAFPSAR